MVHKLGIPQCFGLQVHARSVIIDQRTYVANMQSKDSTVPLYFWNRYRYKNIRIWELTTCPRACSTCWWATNCPKINVLLRRFHIWQMMNVRVRQPERVKNTMKIGIWIWSWPVWHRMVTGKEMLRTTVNQVTARGTCRAGWITRKQRPIQRQQKAGFI